jgi:predicted Zn-dependent protease
MNARQNCRNRLALALAIALIPSTFSWAQETGLPELGSSASELITPAQEQQYGSYTLYQLRRYNYLLEDPLIENWLQTMGHRLGASSDKPKQPYTFFMMRDRRINAFATLGGYIGMNAGLVLTAKTEDEVAGVLSHEISHVTQKHVLRSVERAQKDQIPIMLAALGVIIAAQSASSSSNTDNSANNAAMAAAIGAQALMVQRQIDYTRSNESEADRIGLQTLYRAGYRPEAMADFFARMESTGRANAGGYTRPDYLSSHPVTAIRISEARDRAQRIQQESPNLNLGASGNKNPLLPEFGHPANIPALTTTGKSDFDWAKERLRVLSAASPTEAISEYKRGIDGFDRSLNEAQRYGLALAHIRNRQGGDAESLLTPLQKRYPDSIWLGLARAEAAQAAKKPGQAQDRFEQLLTAFPRNRAVVISYAQFLLEQDDSKQALRAQEVLRQLDNDGQDALLQRHFARAYELSGNLLRAAEAHAEVAFLNGRVDDAINQLTTLLKNDDLDYYQRTRVEARIAAFRPISLELERQGIKPDKQGT